MTDLDAILGVAKDADAAAIRKAYRRKAKALHPDVGGGADEFRALGLAYDVLHNAARRARYDATGDTGEGERPTDEQAEALALVIETLDGVLAKVVAERADPSNVLMIKTMGDALKMLRAQIVQTNAEMTRQATNNGKLRVVALAASMVENYDYETDRSPEWAIATPGTFFMDFGR